MSETEHWAPEDMIERCAKALYRHWQRQGETTSHEDVRVVLEAAFPTDPRGVVDLLVIADAMAVAVLNGDDARAVAEGYRAGRIAAASAAMRGQSDLECRPCSASDHPS